MKSIFYALLTLVMYNGFTQKTVDLERLIPNTASMVVKINGKDLTQKVGMKNIAKSEAFLKMLEGEIFLGNDKKRVTEIGVNLEKDVFMMYSTSQNMTYTAYMYHIEKPKLFAKYIAEKNEFVETVKTANYTVIYYKGSDYYYSNSVEHDFLAWNNDFAIYVDVSYVADRAYEQEQVVGDSPYEVAEEAYMEEAPVEIVDYDEEAVEAVEESAVYETPEYDKEQEAARIARIKRQDSLKEAERLQKLAFSRNIFAQELNKFFGDSAGIASIIDNKSYAESKNDGADVSFWMSLESRNLISNTMYNYSSYRRRYDMPGMLSMFLGAYAGKDMNGHLFFNDQNITIKSNVSFMPEIAELLQGIYDTKIPKSYLKYINNEKVLGVSSASLNSVKLWEAFPSIYAEAMMLSSYRYPNEKEVEGVRVLVDFVSIMMDEEALGKLATGNAVLVLKDLVPTEVEYYTYEYNEDYTESKRVKKTKTEVFPDFLLMFGSENKAFMTKLLDLACKNEMMHQNGNYYYTDGKDRDFPFQLYFTLTEEMAFVSTNLNEIQNLSEGKTSGNLDKKVAANMIKNSSYFNLNLPELLSRIPEEQMSSRELKMLNYFKDNGGEIEWYNNYDKDQSFGEMSMKTPAKFKNSALFVWDLIETAEQF
ncbi:MAG: hypothetical protein R3279_05485 [Putridiphycobacter sp.]|nr:hypothetical protein [Putridiphycobacter sp.]